MHVHINFKLYSCGSLYVTIKDDVIMAASICKHVPTPLAPHYLHMS